MKYLESDVAIVGGGSAGLAAAAAAAENGLRVTVFEKAPDFSFGGMGTFAIESRHQRQRRIPFTKEDAYRAFMQHNHYRSDARLVKDYVDRSAGTIEWLESMGVLFAEPVAYYPGGHYTWHMKDEKSPRITDALAGKARKLGAVIYLETPVKQIFKENGKITGLTAESKTGEVLRVKARAVIIATGGFSENVEWVRQYTGHELGKDISLVPNDPPRLHGDGIRMAWELGAAKTEMYIDSYRGLPMPYGGPGGTIFELGTFRQPLLMVNMMGERFVNEDIVFDGASSGNAVYLQKNSCGFIIFDEDTNHYYEENDWEWILPSLFTRSKDLASIIQKARQEGYKHLFMADSMEALCSQTGINLKGLMCTLEEYNRACDTGRDVNFYKKAAYLKPVRKPKFYAGRFMLNGYVSLGGVRINHKTEVLNNDMDVIPGLYTAGNDSNNICGDTYTFSLAGHMSGFAYNSGRIAGENAAEYVKGK
jgi:fumarate reductase flavoprotein subunit